MTASDRKRYHAERVRWGFAHADVKHWLRLRGWIEESTNELDTVGVNRVIEAMAGGDLSTLPPCPDTEGARAIAREGEAPQTPGVCAEPTQAQPWTGNHGLIRYYLHCGVQHAGTQPPITYGKDNRIVGLLRRAHSDAEIRHAIRRFWCLEGLAGEGWKLQRWLDSPEVYRTWALLHTVFQGLMPELFPATGRESIDRITKRLRQLVRERPGRRSAHVPGGGAASRTHRPSTAAEFSAG